jgi:hypothetical protein
MSKLKNRIAAIRGEKVKLAKLADVPRGSQAEVRSADRKVLRGWFSVEDYDSETQTMVANPSVPAGTVAGDVIIIHDADTFQGLSRRQES